MAMAWLTRSFSSMRLGKPVRKSCSAEWVICSAIARAALTSRKTMTAPVALPFAIVDGGDGVFDGNFKSVAPDEDRSSTAGARSGFAPPPSPSDSGMVSRLVGVQDPEHFGHGPAGRFLQRPAGHFFRRRD